MLPLQMKPQTVSVYYRNIEDLPLSAFKRLIVDNDLRALIVFGDATTEDLRLLKGNILDQVGRLTIQDYDDFRQEHRRIESENLTIQVLKQTLIGFCTDAHSGHITTFKSLGISIDPGPDLNEYKKRVYEVIKARELALHVRIARFHSRATTGADIARIGDRFEKLNVKPPALTHEYFDTLLGAINEMRKSNYDDSISTAQFILHCKELTDLLIKSNQN